MRNAIAHTVRNNVTVTTSRVDPGAFFVTEVAVWDKRNSQHFAEFSIVARTDTRGDARKAHDRAVMSYRRLALH